MRPSLGQKDGKMLGQLVYKICCRTPIKRCLEPIPFVRRIYNGWAKTHPFDVAHGTDTSGYVAVAGITDDQSLQQKINAYAASQPTIVRKALSKLADPREYTFVDLGCGKGRAAVVASEFPFSRIIGVELSAQLAKIAQDNVAKVISRFPGRAPMTIVEGNALEHPLPQGKVVLFLCHSFGRELVAELLRIIDRNLHSGAIEHLVFVYYNPVHGDLLDASKNLTRMYADVVPYDESEIGYGPDLEDTVVIWQSARGPQHKPAPRADRQIIIKKALWTAGLAKAAAFCTYFGEELAMACLMRLPI
jgi:SAM-dependent methyltransferase